MKENKLPIKQMFLPVQWEKNRLVCDYKGATVSILYARDDKSSTRENMELDLNIVVFDVKAHG